MNSLYFRRTNEIKKEKENLEKSLNISLKIIGKKVIFEGDSLSEYEALIVLEAIEFGFSAKKAITLKNEEMIFRKVPIRNFTRRKDLSEVRGRIIGTEGKTKRTMEEISNCWIILNENTVGIIGKSESIEEGTTAVINLIRGSKQANVYRYLEKINRYKKENKKENY